MSINLTTPTEKAIDLNTRAGLRLQHRLVIFRIGIMHETALAQLPKGDKAARAAIYHATQAAVDRENERFMKAWLALTERLNAQLRAAESTATLEAMAHE